MTVRCPSCSRESDCIFRCEYCGRDLAEEGQQ